MLTSIQNKKKLVVTVCVILILFDFVSSVASLYEKVDQDKS